MGQTRHQIVLFRGGGCESLEVAVAARLHLRNKSSHFQRRGKDDMSPPGVYFVPSREGAIDWAKKVGEQEGNIPYMVTLTITPESFPYIAPALWSVDMSSPIRRQHTYRKPGSFDEIGQGQICIDLKLISDEGFQALNTKITLWNGEEFVEHDFYPLLEQAKNQKEGGGLRISKER